MISKKSTAVIAKNSNLCDDAIPIFPLVPLDSLNAEDLLSYEMAISHSFIPTAEINNADRVIMRFRQSSHGQGDYDHDSNE